ncbi:MAG: hypothetical protein L3J99_06225 [Thermoplasmata archaeon]|nr:hypothetical protein [Thermoplasmata archaeon]
MRIAREVKTGVPIPDLMSLLPEAVSRSEVEAWLAGRPDMVRVEGEVALPTGVAPSDRSHRRLRGQEYVRAARSFVEGPLGLSRSWLRCVGITGSTAYGEPEEGDDIDFIAVTRSGAVWLFLAYCYLALRIGTPRTVGGERPEWCFNFVLDDSSAVREFGRPQGFLIAREALSVQILWGEEYYRSLLGAASWLQGMIPRLFGQRAAPTVPPPPCPAPRLAQLANLAIFPFLATYLQLVALVRNDRYRRGGLLERVFTARTRLTGISYESVRFDRLMAWSDQAGGPIPQTASETLRSDPGQPAGGGSATPSPVPRIPSGPALERSTPDSP